MARKNICPHTVQASFLSVIFHPWLVESADVEQTTDIQIHLQVMIVGEPRPWQAAQITLQLALRFSISFQAQVRSLFFLKNIYMNKYP